ALTFQNHTNCPLTDLGGKTCIFSHPVYLFLREFSLQDSRGGSVLSLFVWLGTVPEHTGHMMAGEAPVVVSNVLNR
ncbi:hypothetical protein, partial [Escherichia coli]|uniref:hypothetical protein n=1 Tax=Escherichia coli TaxID=562 RepID=UPI001BC85981